MVSSITGLNAGLYGQRNRGITSFADNLQPSYSSFHNMKTSAEVQNGTLGAKAASRMAKTDASNTPSSASYTVARARAASALRAAADGADNAQNIAQGANPLASTDTSAGSNARGSTDTSGSSGSGSSSDSSSSGSSDGHFDYGSAGVTTTDQAIKDASSKVKDQTLSQEDFLKLLTAQLKAQDPTNPTDNNQLVTQMSQLSMVESLNSINDNMKGVIDTVSSTSALNATSLIGTYVYTDNNKGFFDGQSGVKWAIDAGNDTYSDIKITVRDSSTGEVVYTDSAQALSGEIKFAWPGVYSPEGPIKLPDSGTGGGSGSGGTGEGGEGSGETGEIGNDTSKHLAREADSSEGTGEGDKNEGTGGTGSADKENGIDVDGDGKIDYKYCAAGKYTLEVTGVNKAGNTVSIPSKSLALVTSVTLGKTMDDTMLTLYGQGSISFAKAQKVTI